MDDIQQGKYYLLGRKAFYIFLAVRAASAVMVFFISLIVFIFKLYFSNSYIVTKFSVEINWVIFTFFLLGVIALMVSIVLSFMEYRTARIMLDDAGFHIVRGVFNRDEIVIPYRRIQSVEIKQTLFYRIVGLGHVDIATTTSLERPSEIKSEINEEVIPVIEYPLANLIEKTLISRAEVERMEMEKR